MYFTEVISRILYGVQLMIGNWPRTLFEGHSTWVQIKLAPVIHVVYKTWPKMSNKYIEWFIALAKISIEEEDQVILLVTMNVDGIEI